MRWNDEGKHSISRGTLRREQKLHPEVKVSHTRVLSFGVDEFGVWAKLALKWLQIPGLIVSAYLSIVVNLSVYCVARMSVNAPKHELIQLIYRHLKEHGFHSAAEELQIHSPQVHAPAPTRTQAVSRLCLGCCAGLCQGLHRLHIFFRVVHV